MCLCLCVCVCVCNLAAVSHLSIGTILVNVGKLPIKTKSLVRKLEMILKNYVEKNCLYPLIDIYIYIK